MGKRFVIWLAAAISAVTGCYKVEGESRGTISLVFAHPVRSVMTKGGALPDTNLFLLSIKGLDGETLYEGAYGKRPASLEVPAGTYEVEVLSDGNVQLPAFEMPLYGDRQIVIVENGARSDVRLACRLLNSGIKFSFSESFKERYGGGGLVLKQAGAELPYPFGENRTAWFTPGDVEVGYRIGGGGDTLLFVRLLREGEIHVLTLCASSHSSEARISMSLDTSATQINEEITVGENHPGADGSSPAKAFDIAAAKGHAGDTCWVWGYIVGGDLTSGGVSFSPPFSKNTNIAIGPRPDTRQRDMCMSVELSKAAVRSALNLVDNPQNLGRKVFLKGLVTQYYGLAGLKNVSDFSLGE